jgi:4-diphosphocytidyl-2-C-methyl-D-erythritol kinase
VSGIGHEVAPIRAGRKRWAVLVNPGFEVSTAWVYSELDRHRSGTPVSRNSTFNKLKLTLEGNRHKISSRTSKAFLLTERSFSLHNDLEVITIGRYPVIEIIKERLRSLGAKGVLMSGSGPTVFGLFPDGSSAYSAAAVWRREQTAGGMNRNGPWLIRVARLLDRPPW